MPSWRRRSVDRARRSSSPSSPATPLSPSSIPQWLRPGRANGGIMPPGRAKILFIACVCMMLGWSVTTVLSNDAQQIGAQPFDNTYAASTGMLDDPIGFGVDIPSQTKVDEAEQSNSIKDALGNLHKAVTDKISGWRGHTSAYDIRPSNLTASAPPPATAKPPGNGSFTTTKEAIVDGLNEDERLGARTRIGKCTILFNGNELWERAIRSHEAHDRLHGYRLHVLRQHLLDDVWSKPAYILSLLLRELAKPESERLEWLFWVDADTILLNPHIPIEAFLPPPGPQWTHIHLLFSNDWNGLNNGVFPIRVNKWSVELLTAILAFRYYRPDAPLVFRDQSAMDVIMNEPKFASGIIRLPQRWFNAYQGEHNETLAPHQIRRGDLLVHFAGVGNRDERMAFWLDRAESHLDDWEVPYKSTSYPEEVREFWAEQARAKAGMKAESTALQKTANELHTKVNTLLEEFGDRISPEVTEELRSRQKSLQAYMEGPGNLENLEGMRNVTTKLESALGPLETVKKEGHGVLLKSAHDAVFDAERELLSAGFYDGVSSPEAVGTEVALKQVKEMILTSEESWNRQQIIAAIDALTSQRAMLHNRRVELQQAAAAQAEAALGHAMSGANANQVNAAAAPANSALGHPQIDTEIGGGNGHANGDSPAVESPTGAQHPGDGHAQAVNDAQSGTGQLEGQAGSKAPSSQ